MHYNTLTRSWEDSDSLQHWGIPGMKWGERRYQNKDGSLTPQGKLRYSRDERDNLTKKKGNKVNLSDNSANAKRWVKEDMTRGKNVTDNAGNLVRATRELERVTSKPKENPRLDLSKKTDAELREAINRELLERQYNQVFNAPQVSKGREAVRDVLDVTGSTLAVVSAGLGIALAVKELKG